MKRQVLKDMLERHANAEVGDARIEIPSATEVSLYLGVGVGMEPLILDRISEILLEEEALVAITRRNERYVIAYEDVRAVRLCPEGRGAGY